MIISEIVSPNYPSGDMEGLKNEIFDHTYVNPFAEFELIWENKAALELKFFKTHLRLSAIRTLERGKGYGSECMRWLCGLADKYNIAIELSVDPFGQKPKNGEPKKLNAKGLKSWYQRYGFKPTGAYNEYRRMPQHANQ